MILFFSKYLNLKKKKILIKLIMGVKNRKGKMITSSVDATGEIIRMFRKKGIDEYKTFTKNHVATEKNWDGFKASGQVQIIPFDTDQKRPRGIQVIFDEIRVGKGIQGGEVTSSLNLIKTKLGESHISTKNSNGSCSIWRAEKSQSKKKFILKSDQNFSEVFDNTINSVMELSFIKDKIIIKEKLMEQGNNKFRKKSKTILK